MDVNILVIGGLKEVRVVRCVGEFDETNKLGWYKGSMGFKEVLIGGKIRGTNESLEVVIYL